MTRSPAAGGAGAPPADAFARPGSPLPWDAAFQELRQCVLQAGGIDIGQYKDRCVARRLAARMDAVGVRQLGEYARRARSDPAELRRLVQALTVNVSEFFRNPATFRALAREVLPQVLAQKRQEGRRAIRLWSAGCATGEEAYSLAITLNEVLEASLPEFSVVVFATDVDGPSLQVARAGRYAARSLARLPRQVLRRYFEPVPGGYQVRRAVRRLVHFRQHNLLDAFPFRRIDVAVFRNVLIYMARALHQRLVDAFYDVLNPGGFLVLGKVEGLPGASRDRFEVINLAERIYRRPAGPPAAGRGGVA